MSSWVVRENFCRDEMMLLKDVNHCCWLKGFHGNGVGQETLLEIFLLLLFLGGVMETVLLGLIVKALEVQAED